MVLDNEQQRAVDVRHNVVVSAGAGSGKTRVLAERYMALLRNGEAGVPEILALTFTRKAAAEMFGRIYAYLKEETELMPSLQRELNRFDEARISTIDSFCLGIVRDGLSSFGLPATIESDDRRFNREAQRLALTFLLENHDDPVVAAYIRQYGVDGTTDNLLVPLITGHIHISREHRFSEDFDRQQRWLDDRRVRLESSISEVLDQVAQLQPGSPSGVQAHTECLARRDDFEALLSFMRDLRKTFGKKGDSEAFKELLNTLFDKTGSRPAGYLAEWDLIRQTQLRSDERAHLFDLLDNLRLRVLAERRSSGILGHQEVMEMAVRLLREDTDLRRLYARQYKFIMIDEFQDNNETQRDLLFLLADTGGDGSEASDGTARDAAAGERAVTLDTGKLFFVGDQKQSIYRFRGADVAVFRNLEKEVARSLSPDVGQNARINLSTNYRSTPTLISFYNVLFPAVFGDATQAYEAEFSPLRAGAETAVIDGHEDPTSTIPNDVTVAWVPPRDDEDGVEYAKGELAEGAWIADEIARLVHQENYTYGDMAILVRSSAGQQAYERMLRRRGIPYQTQAVRSLFTEAPAHDLYALLQLHYHPSDDEAFVAYLRSPLVMLSDAALVRVMSNRRAHGDMENLFAAPDYVSEDDRLKLQYARDLYDMVGERLDRVPLYEVIRAVWDEGGYRYGILHRASDHSYLEHYDYLFSLALQYMDRPAIEFVDFLREQMGDTEKLDELNGAKTDNVVQLMTIHKSKGLQFPAVFVADCDRQLQARSELIWEDPDLGVTIRLPAEEPGDTTTNVIESHAREEEQRRTEAEMKRLLYVAATRAESKLYFSASVRRSERGASFFGLIRNAMNLDTEKPATDDLFSGMVRLVSIPPMTEGDLRHTAIPQTARRRRSDAEVLLRNATVPPMKTRRVEVTPTMLNEYWARTPRGQSDQGELFPPGSPPGSPHDASPRAATLGTLTHRLLERTVDEGTPVPQDQWTPMHPDVIPILGPAGTPEERTTLCRESWEMAQRFLDSSLFQRVTSEDGAVIHTELPFLLKWGEPYYLLSGKMDFVVEREGDVYVIDFKTDTEIDPDRYRPQIAVYRAAAAELFGKSVITCLYYLRHGKSVELTGELDAYLLDPTMKPL